jgi:hypothetical protein
VFDSEIAWTWGECIRNCRAHSHRRSRGECRAPPMDLAALNGQVTDRRTTECPITAFACSP